MALATNDANTQRRLPGLDGLRALSIGFVILTHLGFYNWLVEHHGFTYRQLEPFSGGSGVQVFFVISGFLITTLLLREQERRGSVSIRNFLIRRALRIFPVYYLFLAVLAALMFWQVLEVSKPGFAMAATYTSNFVPRVHNSAEIGHTWSLAVEEHFYLLWPLLFVGCGRFGSPIALAAILALCGWVRYRMGLGIAWTDTYYTTRWTLPAFDSIIVGCLTALLWNRAEWWRNWVARVPLVWCLAGVALFGAYLWMPGAWFWAIETVKAAGAALVIVAVTSRGDQMATRLLDWPPMRYCGVISYSLYIWQGLFLRTGPGPGPWFQQYPQNLALTVGVAILSYHFFEKWFLRRKEKFVRA